MRKLSILVGIPGSGKSTYAETLPGTIVSTDCIRKSIYGSEDVIYAEDVAEFLINHANYNCFGMSETELNLLKTQLCEDYVFQLARLKSKELLIRRKNVIYDSTNHKIKYRRAILEVCNGEYDYCDAHYFAISLETALMHNQHRERKEPETVIRRIYEELEKPDYNEGYQKILIIRNC